MLPEYSTNSASRADDGNIILPGQGNARNTGGMGRRDDGGVDITPDPSGIVIKTRVTKRSGALDGDDDDPRAPPSLAGLVASSREEATDLAKVFLNVCTHPLVARTITPETTPPADDATSASDDDSSTGSEIHEEKRKSRAFTLQDVSPPQLVLVNLPTAHAALRRMMNLECRPEHQPYLSGVDSLAFGFIVAFHRHLQENPLECRQLTAANTFEGGIYRKDVKTGQTMRMIHERLNEQLPFDEAGLVLTSSECLEFMQRPEFRGFIKEAIAMKPFCLQCLPGNEKMRDQLLAHMFLEMGVAACHKGYTHQVFELLTWTPSEDLEAIVTPPDKFNPNATRALRDAKLLVPIFSWGPARSKLEEDMDDPSIPEARGFRLYNKVCTNQPGRLI